jgi:serine/threonine protein kinase
LLVERGRLPLPQALAYAGAIFDGLEAAHRLGIIHRDVKPENIFLGVDGGLKIVDFGNAKLLNYGLKSTDPHKVFGTAAYMSPEQLGFRSSVGPRSDLYSVGLILYEMLRGRHAFSEGPDPYDLPPSIELCRMQIEDNPRHLAEVEPRIPNFVSDFVARLMAKDPDLRPASAFLAAREVRDMHDFVLREAHGKGFAPAAITIAPSTPVLERIAVPKRPPEKRTARKPRQSGQTGIAMLVGAVLGAAIFAALFFSRKGSLDGAAAHDLDLRAPATHRETVPITRAHPAVAPVDTRSSIAQATEAPRASSSALSAPPPASPVSRIAASPTEIPGSTATPTAPVRPTASAFSGNVSRKPQNSSKQAAASKPDPYAPIF